MVANTKAPENGALDTFPKLLADLASRRGQAVAIREKDYGIWQETSWSETFENVRLLALGLAARGLKRGDKVAVVGDNRPCLYWAMAAAQVLGAVPVPIYQDSVADEMAFILEHAEVRMVVGEDQEQVDKVLSVRDRLATITHIFYNDSRGMRHYDEPGLESLESLREAGAAFGREHPKLFDQSVAEGKGGDIAIMLYTSGTTGKPKGVMLTFDNVVRTAKNGIAHDNLTEKEEILAYLPMAWVGDYLFSAAESYIAGFTVNCPESAATVLQDLREVGPTYIFAPPRIWESILTTVMVRIEDSSWIKRRLFHHYIKFAQALNERRNQGQAIGIADRLRYRLGDLLVFGPLKNTLGLTRARVVYTAGEAIGPEIFSFYRSLGVNMKQIYGMTEASALVCGQTDDAVYDDTVGPPMPEVELRVEPSGEVMYRSPGVFHGYFKNPEATAETKTEDGWIHSGDAGYLDERGHLKIIDRAKDVGALNDGTIFAPKYLENKLKFSPFVREAVAFGDQRDYATVFVNIDLEAVGNWAERHSIAYTSYTDLAANPEIYDLIEREIEGVNRSLAEDPKLVGSRIRRFLILHKELDPDDNELTRTRKVRRRFVSEKYADLIAALYDGSDTVTVEALVTFEDGRTGTITATLAIRELAPETPPTARAA